MNFLKLFPLLAVPVLFFMQACSTADVRESSFEKSVQIRSGRSYEECVELLPGNIMHYSFTSSGALNFNIHYHDDENIMYPVNAKNTSHEEGSISPDDFDYYSVDQEFFCMMWDNLNPGDVSITFNYSVNPKQ